MSVLRAEGVSVRFGARGAERTVLDGVGVAVAAGELVGLIGPNGAGKTSLLRVLAHLLEPQAGRVLCDGRPLADYRPAERARRIAYLAQGATVHWRMAVERLVALGRLPHGRAWPAMASERDAVDRALRATAIEPFRDRTVDTLSGGERARVMLARALAVEAPVLLADEPIAALDPNHQIHVMDLLRQTAHDGTAVVAVLHDLTLAGRFCDRLVLLHGGHVLADGAPPAVLSEANLARAYGITTVRGRAEGQDYIVPWRRIGDG